MELIENSGTFWYISLSCEGYAENSIDSNMLITPDIATPFHAILIKDGIQKADHYDYRKWLRYYLDFCHKYHHPECQKESLPHFIKKLREKRQTEQQQRQASHAISLYYALLQSTIQKKDNISILLYKSQAGPRRSLPPSYGARYMAELTSHGLFGTFPIAQR